MKNNQFTAVETTAAILTLTDALAASRNSETIGHFTTQFGKYSASITAFNDLAKELITQTVKLGIIYTTLDLKTREHTTLGSYDVAEVTIEIIQD